MTELALTKLQNYYSYSIEYLIKWENDFYNFLHSKFDSHSSPWNSNFELTLLFWRSLFCGSLLESHDKHVRESPRLCQKKSGPGWCGSVDWAQACEPKGCWFNSQSGHMPGLQAKSPVGAAQEATTHWCFSPSLSTFLSLSLKINKIFLKNLIFPVLPPELFLDFYHKAL